ncbi:hypothetical protein [Paenibacillus protaetiae]|uniref:Uncharacterized protein n=1 Tax=Paenibacillus protaetiae TaxID=2509456 RepID=A0A4P6EX23_9BACL|nr:hypothetical protein [Paenibacillus protaetiae]QAY67296.1 hypothetical protein ET464_13695 [Paenibacillus protaetiae]
MGIFSEFIDPYLKYRSLVIGLKRAEYQKLQKIADALNDHMDEDLFTPENIASRVVKTFIDEAYADSTKRIVQAIVPEITRIQPVKTKRTGSQTCGRHLQQVTLTHF